MHTSPDHPERGDSSILLLLLVPVLLLVVGLVVDGGGKIQADEEATLVAQSAARAGVNAAVNPDLGTSGTARISPGQAIQAANAYLATAGVSGHATANSQTVTVTAQIPYTPKFLPVGTLTGEGSGSAELLQEP
jgi:Flp pilus assembly protein TadG